VEVDLGIDYYYSCDLVVGSDHYYYDSYGNYYYVGMEDNLNSFGY